MPETIDPNNADLTVGTEIHGYRIEKIVPLEEINAMLYRLEHLQTGARHVHISNQDSENTFGVTFKTVPTDSTGVAHILEHTVLCGSRNYPVRDPFFSMLKRSLSTFMNAFTASDWTMYPFSTQNRKDYYNLMDVYLDATFFPAIDALSFKQEGHRLEIEKGSGADEPDQLVYKGVVYNEMKGAMSSPDQVMGRSLLNALYPDTTYSNNSGGEPTIIPRLTHERLVAFHKRHYHPSNAYFYTYGNLPLKDHLAKIADKVMRHFDRIDPQTDVPQQGRWERPQQKRYTYPLASNEDPSRKTQITVAWLTCDIRDTFEVLVLSVLEQILLGNAASPLRKALMDSGLGSALSDATGYDADNRDTLFACGLKNCDESAAEAVEKVIFDVLARQVADGLDPELISSAIHQIEFHRKEVTNTPYPYGIKLMLMAIGSWLHGGDPERILQLDDDFERLHREIATDRFLEKRIQHYFLDNPHRVRLVLAPDLNQAQRETQQVREELATLKKQLSEAQLQQIQADAEKLKTLQESPEDISCLPTLALSDIPPNVQIVAPPVVDQTVPVWRYMQPTSGIFYFTAAAGASKVPEALIPWMPFFCYAFPKIGTRQSDYTQIARRIDAATGGLGLNAQARVMYTQSASCLPLVQFNAKCLTRNIDPMYAIIEELIGETDFSDLPRLKQLAGEYRAALDAMIVQNGHRLAISLSSRTLAPSSALSELWSGVHQIRTIRDLTDNLDDAGLERLAGNLAAIGKAVFTRGNLIMSAIGESDAVDASVARVKKSAVLNAFQHDNSSLPFPLLDPAMDGGTPFEGWSTSSAVSFVAQTVPTVCLGHPDAPVLSVLSKLLRSVYLHREIREKGGAYGGFAIYNPENGLFSMASYRDPHIVRTLNVYAETATYLRSAPIDDENIKEAILQACSEIDKPDPPGPAARKAFMRSMVGLTDEARQAYKARLLTVNKAQVVAAADTYLGNGADKAAVAVISGQEQLEQANGQLNDRPLTLHAI